METRWIQDFVTLTEVRNFTRAAELRNVSQAAFSRRIQALERWLGATLVDRSCFPMRITEAGERFRPSAIALLSQIADVKAETAGEQEGHILRVALPFALAATRLAQWWSDWSHGLDVAVSIETGHVLDTMQSLSEGSVDMVICYQHAANPIAPDMSRHEKIVLATEKVRPYSVAEITPEGRRPKFVLPGSAQSKVPLLMYAPTVYFSRVVDSAIDNAPLDFHSTTIVESAMTDVLANMAQKGLGVAWLPDSSLENGRFPDLVLAADDQWSTEVDVVAYRLRNNGRKVLERVWQRIQQRIQLRHDQGGG
ncbi:LysR family transcriptional regulator [Ottowia thiooxydans]|uniref:LysR family transcriptional regulator n=1 Tax=Ottowia thiooxydans TaxID=219182 RepID=UPI0003F789BB|nr:LysR family transcriptional regulator [Ottowia thiooxydans]